VCFDFDNVAAPGEGWRSVTATNGSVALDETRSVSTGRSALFRTDSADASSGTAASVSLVTSHLLGAPGHFALGFEVFPSVYDPPSTASSLASYTFAGVEVGVAIYIDWNRGSSSCNVRMVVGAKPSDGGPAKRQDVALGVIPRGNWSRLRLTSKVENKNVVITAAVGASPTSEVRLPFDGKLKELYMWVGSAPQDDSPRGMTLNFDDVSLEPAP